MDDYTQEYSLKSIFRLALKFRKQLIFANVLAVFAVLASTPLPLFIPLLIDQVLLNEPGRMIALMNYFLPDYMQTAMAYVVMAVSVTVLLRIVAWLLTVWQLWVFSFISKEIIFKMRSHLLSCLKRVSIAEYEDKGGGTISAYLINDLETIDKFFSLTISRVFISCLLLLSISGVLLFLHWELAMFLLILNPMVIFVTMRLGRGMKDLKRKENKAMEVFQQAVVDMLSAIRQIRVSNQQEHYIAKLIRSARDIRNRSIDFTWRSEIGSRFSFLFFLISFDIFRAISMSMVLFSDLSIGVMIAIFGYLWFMLQPLQELLDIQYSWFGAKAAIERVNKIFRFSKEPSYTNKVDPFANHSTVSLTVKDLCLSYGETKVLKNVNLHIKPGEKVAIVGATGGGKTSLVHTLLGLYQPDSGDILYGGESILDIGFTAVRENVGCVLQSPTLLNENIRSNITMGKNIAEEEVWRMLQIVQMEPFIRSLPKQLETIIGLNGVRLSGGQCQRIAIARMLLSKPKVMILDETTSALDSQTEEALHKALFEHMQGQTAVIIAHRLSAVSQADRIYVFESGEIVECGTHDELSEGKGVYQQLFSPQFV